MSVQEFMEKNKSHKTLEDHDYVELFSHVISMAKTYAVGPYFYIKTSNAEHKAKELSSNITEMTPFSEEEWFCNDLSYFSSAFHPEDLEYVLSATTLTKEIYFNASEVSRNNLKFNIYTRYKNKNNEYRWVILQSHFYVNKYQEIESVLYMFYDLSHISVTSVPLLTVTNYNNNTLEYYKHIEDKIQKIDVKIPTITKREKEILKLMIQGFNSPEISQKLSISYTTVENHRQNLRRKTETRTSSELVAFVLKYNLLHM